jgi:hypothetical protein
VSRSRMISPPRVQAPSTASPHYDGPTPPHGPRAGGPRTRKLLVRQPARAQRCRWLLCLCQWFYERTNKLGTRLELPCPRRNQVAPFGHFNCTHCFVAPSTLTADAARSILLTPRSVFPQHPAPMPARSRE